MLFEFLMFMFLVWISSYGILPGVTDAADEFLMDLEPVHCCIVPQADIRGHGVLNEQFTMSRPFRLSCLVLFEETVRWREGSSSSPL